MWKLLLRVEAHFRRHMPCRYKELPTDLHVCNIATVYVGWSNSLRCDIPFAVCIAARTPQSFSVGLTPPKLPLPVEDLDAPSNRGFIWPTWVGRPNSISIGSANFAQHSSMVSMKTDTQTILRAISVVIGCIYAVHAIRSKNSVLLDLMQPGVTQEKRAGWTKRVCFFLDREFGSSSIVCKVPELATDESSMPRNVSYTSVHFIIL